MNYVENYIILIYNMVISLEGVIIMARMKKDGKYINCYLDAIVHKSLFDYCKANHETKTAVIEKALIEYIDKKSKANK